MLLDLRYFQHVSLSQEDIQGIMYTWVEDKLKLKKNWYKKDTSRREKCKTKKYQTINKEIKKKWKRI